MARLDRSEIGIVALAIALVLPALSTGYFIDDYLQMANLEDWGPYHPAPLDLYRFAPRDPIDTEDFIAAGTLPWWSAPELAIGFFRPLASGLLALEHGLFERAAFPRHLHSLLWALAMVLVASRLFKRELPRSSYLLAIFLFAVEDSHAMSIAWIAGRQALIAMTLVLLGLHLHIRWRSEDWRPGRWGALVACALGLLAGETALGALGYVFTWELAARRPRWTRALLPHLGLVLAYVLAHTLADTGARGLDAYLDPRFAPVAFLAAFPGRVLGMLANLAFELPVDLVTFDARFNRVAIVAGGFALAGGAFWLRLAWPRLEERERQALRWLLPGAGLALVPAAAAFPSERALVPATLGAAALFAVLLRDAWQRRTVVTGRGARYALFAALALLGLPNLALAPLLRVGKTVAFGLMSARGQAVAVGAPLALDRRVDVVVLHSEDLQVGVLPAMRIFHGPARPEAVREAVAAATLGTADARGPLGAIRSFRVLSMAATDHVLRRPDPHTFELETPRGTLIDGGFAQLFRSRREPLPTGSMISLVGADVEVLADRDGLPTRVAIRFEKRLDDRELVFLEWHEGGFRHFTVPPVGSELVLHRGPPLWPPR